MAVEVAAAGPSWNTFWQPTSVFPAHLILSQSLLSFLPSFLRLSPGQRGPTRPRFQEATTGVVRVHHLVKAAPQSTQPSLVPPFLLAGIAFLRHWTFGGARQTKHVGPGSAAEGRPAAALPSVRPSVRRNRLFFRPAIPAGAAAYLRSLAPLSSVVMRSLSQCQIWAERKNERPRPQEWFISRPVAGSHTRTKVADVKSCGRPADRSFISDGARKKSRCRLASAVSPSSAPPHKMTQWNFHYGLFLSSNAKGIKRTTATRCARMDGRTPTVGLGGRD